MVTAIKTRVKKLRVPGPKAKAYVERDAAVISPSYTRTYPFVMDHGQGSEVWDVDGVRYLDFTAGIAVTATGHCHPAVVKAIQEQAEKFIHMSGTDFYYPVQIELAEKLTSLIPGDEPMQVFFTNSGTESVEAAIKLARYHTGCPRLIAFVGAFHGRSMGSLSLTASKYVQREGFAPLVPGVTHVPFGYCYRCAYKMEYPKCDVYCVKFIEEQVLARYVPASEVAALFVEPIQGEGGYVVPPPLYFIRLKELCDKYDILFVDDEIQAGMGRTGKWWAIEHWGVEPDIVTIAKGIASGMPLGVMAARRSLMTWPPGAHGNTFGGNPISCAAALATIRLIEEEDYLGNAERMGKYMLENLRRMQADHPSMGDVRGLGLMIGVEIVKDKATREPVPDLRNAVVQGSFERGLLILGCGPTSLRFMPALNVTQDAVDEALVIFEDALTEAEETV
ncbi:MAG: acetyl ornithine aminotransferase family protein [Chloroflexi bacterium]|nr:acetyl ornithine aminotransferase family protein [Chloroflexota bacterium]